MGVSLVKSKAYMITEKQEVCFFDREMSHNPYRHYLSLFVRWICDAWARPPFSWLSSYSTRSCWVLLSVAARLLNEGWFHTAEKAENYCTAALAHYLLLWGIAFALVVYVYMSASKRPRSYYRLQENQRTHQCTIHYCYFTHCVIMLSWDFTVHHGVILIKINVCLWDAWVCPCVFKCEQHFFRNHKRRDTILPLFSPH